MHGTDVSLQRPTRDIFLIFYFRCIVIVLAYHENTPRVRRGFFLLCLL